MLHVTALTEITMSPTKKILFARSFPNLSGLFLSENGFVDSFQKLFFVSQNV